MNSNEILQRIQLKEQEIEKLNSLIIEAEKRNDHHSDEKKIQHYKEEKLILRQEINTLLTKLPVSDQVRYKADDTVRNILVEIGVRGVTNVLTTVAIGASGVLILVLTLRYYKSSLSRVASSLWSVPQQYYRNTTQRMANAWDSVNPMTSYHRWRATKAAASNGISQSPGKISSWMPKISLPDYKSIQIPSISTESSKLKTSISLKSSNLNKEGGIATQNQEKMKDTTESPSSASPTWIQSMQDAAKQPLNTIHSTSSSISSSLRSIIPPSILSSTEENSEKSKSEEIRKMNDWKNVDDVAKKVSSSSQETVKQVKSKVSSIFERWGGMKSSEQRPGKVEVKDAAGEKKS